MHNKPVALVTDLNNFEGTGTVQQVARHSASLALLDESGHIGTFSNERRQLPW
ncbi:hypothetical protein [Salipaludibacillus neizhouensis]|uniref:hypothetical protein n=1 Tax=Salipaludibacillus neizhouensis TaxID=885475 RepID=UPI0016006B71|nr:hypothetical protein [Salipaludibacillus neizhouensis]